MLTICPDCQAPFFVSLVPELRAVSSSMADKVPCFRCWGAKTDEEKAAHNAWVESLKPPKLSDLTREAPPISEVKP